MRKIKIEIINEQKKVKIPSGLRILLRRCCNATLSTEKFDNSAEISIKFVDNEKIRSLNKIHRNVDCETDVLSFPMGKDGKYDINPETGASILGDIVISMEKAYDQAKSYGHSLQREVGYLTTHAVLHLLGYDHINVEEKNMMRDIEEDIMEKVGLSFTQGLYSMSKVKL